MNTNNLITWVIYLAQVFLVVRMTNNLIHAALAIVVTTIALTYVLNRFLPSNMNSTVDMVIGGIGTVIVAYLFYTKYGGMGVVALFGSSFIAGIIGSMIR